MPCRDVLHRTAQRQPAHRHVALACTDLAVFKAFFNRTRDWADLEDMAAAGALDRDRVLGILVEYLGPGDHRVARLHALR